MARIFVLEDEELSRKALVQMLLEISGEITVDAAANLVDARELLGGTVSFDLFLLDINLSQKVTEDTSGIIFAEEIRAIKKYSFTPIVMVTSIAGFEMESYRRLHCYQYLVKPYDFGEIKDLVEKVLFYVQQEKKEYILVKKKGINYKILCDEIEYCKAIPRGVCIYMKDERMEVPYLSIQKLLDKLPHNHFFQCHRMYIVNKQAVKYYDLVNQMIQVQSHSELIDIGVTFKQEVRRIMNE